MKPIRIVNVPDVSDPADFVDLPQIDGRPVEWIGHSGMAANALERRITRPRLSRYRAAFNAARDAARSDAILSHLPLMTGAVEAMTALQRRRAPHLAFSFNFTALPAGKRLRLMTRQLRDVERFCVYSRYEIGLYADLLGIPEDRFRQVMWGQEPPVLDLSMPVPARPFVAAVGGEGRDRRAIVEAARASPDIDWVVITRPAPEFENPPANLIPHFNLPGKLTWGIASRAAAVAVPLLSETTACGHITLASAQLLGLPLITTRSLGTREYVEGFRASTLIEPNDPEALAAAARAAVADAPALRALAESERDHARDWYDRAHWANLIRDFIRDFVPKAP